jgi:DNA-directed RNA polymerase subunit M/transcription elongation factor TFIIS
MLCPNCKIQMVKTETKTNVKHECEKCHYDFSAKKSIADIMRSDIIDTLKSSADSGHEESESKLRFFMENNFWNYSAYNSWMLFFQMKNPYELVNSIKRWKEIGREVIKNSKSYVVLAPRFIKQKDESGNIVKDENGKSKNKGIYFKTVNVYPYDSTEGNDLPEFSLKSLNLSDKMVESYINTIISKFELPIEFSAIDLNVGGYVNAEKIVLNSVRTRENNLYTLLHEIGHYYSGHVNNHETTTQKKEIQAELTAFLIGLSIGMPKGSFEYLNAWTGNDFDVIDTNDINIALKNADKIKKLIQNVKTIEEE